LADGDASVRVARIQAWQAILVAVVGVVGGVLSTLVTQRLATPAMGSQASRTEGFQSSPRHVTNPGPPAAPNPPATHYYWKGTQLGLEPCKSQAETLLRQSGAANIDVQSHTVFGISGPYQLWIGCMTDYKLVILVASGPNEGDASKLSKTLTDGFEP
jgi:hypothetical protein